MVAIVIRLAAVLQHMVLIAQVEYVFVQAQIIGVQVIILVVNFKIPITKSLQSK
jgi:hypothetical protein